MKKILISFAFIFILTIVLVGCGKKPQPEPEEKPDLLPSEINASIILPEGYVWTSSNPEILNEQGMLFVPEEDTVVTMTAQKGDKKYDYEVNVTSPKKDPFSTAYKSYAGKIENSYYKNGSFKCTQYRTYKVEFNSLNPEVISNDGVIYQTDYDQEAIIEIKITNTENNEVRIYYKKTTIRQYAVDTYAAIIASWVDTQIEEFKNGNIEKLPTKHEKYPSTIEWTGGGNIVVLKDGTVIKPVEYVRDSISCLITYSDYTILRTYKFEDFGGNTEEAFLDGWLSYIMPTEITTHKNYVYLEKDNDYYFHHQIQIYTGGVLNLVDGKPITINQDYFNDVSTSYKNVLWYTYGGKKVHSPDVPQSYLDKAFYPGYQMPNESDILWVVVHESGMARPGETAELLAKTQHNDVYVTEDPRAASWHYQVDENYIYQSFDNELALWHAGGNYTTSPNCYYGNSNSIGIEMCINADGNYDGSMHHDTKLVATLCNMYNLGIENVKRHFDFSGKECPAYMIRTNRWTQFLEWTAIELNAIKYLSDAEVNWTVSDLDTLFTKGPNGLYYAKAVTQKTDVTITLDVVKGDYHFNKTVTVSLYPDNIDLSIWQWVEE